MSPIDDELRAALQRRATVVPPSPDPLAGIERRATRMQRNRLAASVAGSVLAVAAVATAVPLLSATPSGPDTTRLASAQPSAPATGPSTGPSAGATEEPGAPYALDLDERWPYRGVPLEQLGQGTVETIARELAVRHRVDESAVDLVPLWGQVHEPSQASELVYAATVEGEQRWGYATSSEAGPEFRVDEPLPSPALALAAALPGDEVARLVVVASPEATAIEYGPDDAGEFAEMTGLADGVAVTPLEGDPATDSVRVLGAQGEEVFRGEAPDVAAPAGEPGAPPASEPPTPTNVVDWPARGSVPDELRERAVASFAQQAGVPVSQVRTRLLFGGRRGDRTYVLLQGWYGGDARSFAWSYDPQGDRYEEALLQGVTPPGPSLFTALLSGVLLVVPEPTAGQVLYAPDASSEPQPVPDQGTEVAVLIDRAEGAAGDRLLILDGDGDPESPIYRGTVDDALASMR